MVAKVDRVEMGARGRGGEGEMNEGGDLVSGVEWGFCSERIREGGHVMERAERLGHQKRQVIFRTRTLPPRLAVFQILPALDLLFVHHSFINSETKSTRTG